MTPHTTRTLLQCGLVSQASSDQPIWLRPTRVSESSVDQLISGGWGCPGCITESAVVVSWGHAQQLGNKLEEPRGVVCAAFGWNHAVLATREGVFVLELSQPSTYHHSTLPGDQTISAVAAGEAHR